MNHKKFYVIMGVSGSGKTTIGRMLAGCFNCPFYDADDFHPAENVARMAAGIPLTDADRTPWLNALRSLIRQHLETGQTAVLACSALKRSYRDHLREGCEAVCFIHLDGRFDLIQQRMQSRPNHYMKPDMLQSQFTALEPPTDHEAITINIDKPVKTIIQEIVKRINVIG